MKQRRHGRGWSPLVGGALAMAMMLAACGGGDESPTALDTEAVADEQTEEAPTEGDATEVAAEGECTLSPVLAEVEGLEGEERANRLVELASEESGTVNMYGSIGADDIEPVVAAFKDKYGFDVSIYSASSEEVLQRVVQEESAGRAGADVVENNGTELILLTREGALAEFDSPYGDQLIEGMEFPTWLGTRFNVFTVLFNSNNVSEDEAPQNFQDLADPRWDGVLGVDAGNWDHFATIVKYMMENDGMTEEEAIGVWEKILDNVQVYNSNTPVAEAVQSGELDAGITYNHYYTRFTGRGETPIEWQPAIQPQVLRPNGVAVACSSANPASGLLLLEFLVSQEGQQILGDTVGRDVAHKDVEAGLLPQANEPLETVVIDLEDIIDNSEKWSSAYESLIQGQPVKGE